MADREIDERIQPRPTPAEPLQPPFHPDQPLAKAAVQRKRQRQKTVRWFGLLGMLLGVAVAVFSYGDGNGTIRAFGKTLFADDLGALVPNETMMLWHFSLLATGALFGLVLGLAAAKCWVAFASDDQGDMVAPLLTSALAVLLGPGLAIWSYRAETEREVRRFSVDHIDRQGLKVITIAPEPERPPFRVSAYGITLQTDNSRSLEWLALQCWWFVTVVGSVIGAIGALAFFPRMQEAPGKG